VIVYSNSSSPFAFSLIHVTQNPDLCVSRLARTDSVEYKLRNLGKLLAKLHIMSALCLAAEPLSRARC
jgi:hypothetical protein